jgi:uncharacterized damage-inducible protein DinB
MTSPLPELWLRGPIDGVPAALQPVAHAILQALEETEERVAELDTDLLWETPGGAASLGFHLRHMAGSLERLFTYARGDPLSDAQRKALAGEKNPTPDVTVAALIAQLRAAVQRAVEQLRDTAEADLNTPRAVGRAGLPSTVLGLLYHAGEHTARHSGQVATTVKILRSRQHPPDA